ncbi:MAG: histidine phosphatase family protein [Mariprofundaceae bacterium]|nr:histidine phosphatase family protein [Mariprofundaceae bacterium]
MKKDESAGKTLLLIRHAKAISGDFSQADVIRILSKRGEKQAHNMAHQINHEALNPDIIFSSSAKRTAMTTNILMADMAMSAQQVQWRDDLYLAEADVLFNTIRQADNGIQKLALVAHNPGLSELANILLSDGVTSMSPCTVVAISWPVQHWSDISVGSGVLCAYLEPLV